MCISSMGSFPVQSGCSLKIYPLSKENSNRENVLHVRFRHRTALPYRAGIMKTGMSVCPYIHQSICLSIGMFVHPYVCQYGCTFICPFIHP